MKNEKPFYSLEEVAGLLGVNYQLIYRLVRSGELTAARIGKVYRVDRRDLEAYLERTKRVASSGNCGWCGKRYQSALSFPGQCPECADPICLDCWNRLGVRTCKAHAEPIDGKERGRKKRSGK